MKSALLAIHYQSSVGSSHVHSNGLICDIVADSQEGPDARRRDSEYDEEEWASWSSFTRSEFVHDGSGLGFL